MAIDTKAKTGGKRKKTTRKATQRAGRVARGQVVELPTKATAIVDRLTNVAEKRYAIKVAKWALGKRDSRPAQTDLTGERAEKLRAEMFEALGKEQPK